MLAVLATIAIATQADREFEGLFLDVPAGIQFTTKTEPVYRSYVGELKSAGPGGATGVTQVISVVVTDLDKIPNRPTPEQVIRMHEQTSRTRKTFAGQVMKAGDTTIGGRPMTVILGSALVPGADGKPTNAYHISACATHGDQAYEVTWYTYRFGEDFTNAVRAVRNLRIKTGDASIGPVKHIGTEGSYSFLGVPYSWRLPTVLTADTRPQIQPTHAGRYRGSVWVGQAFAQIDIIRFKEAPKDMTPAAMAREVTTGWLPDAGAPEPTVEGGIYRFDNLTLNRNRKGRIEVALKDNTLVALTVSGPDSLPLPSRGEVALNALP